MSNFNKWHWLPKVFATLFIGFLSMFALDVFGEGYVGLELLMALFMHLIPSLILLLVLGLAWRNPIWGGWGFVGLGLVALVFFKTYRDPAVFGLISLPPVVIGVLFIWSSRWRLRGGE